MTVEDDVRAQHPTFIVREDKVQHTISPETDPERYEAMIAERVAWAEEAALTAGEQEAEQAERAQARAVYQALKAGTATPAQTQRFVAMLGKHVYRLLGDQAEP